MKTDVSVITKETFGDKIMQDALSQKLCLAIIFGRSYISENMFRYIVMVIYCILISIKSISL